VVRINLRRPDLGTMAALGKRGYNGGHNGPKEKYIAFTTDCNGTYCYLDPYEGGKTAVAEAVRNLVCSGARPLAVTDCLNFGNPMKPEIFWQFRRCVEGLSEACSVFGTPVTGGNVSFYNESPVSAIDPTPVIGMLGLIDDPKQITTQWFKGRSSGDVILLLGEICEATPTLGLGGSEYLKRIHGLKTGRPPRMDLASAKRISDFTLGIIQRGWLKSAHDCSEGGLGVALAECCMSNGDAMTGATIDLSASGLRLDALLFGETQSRMIISATEKNVRQIQSEADRSGIAVTVLGQTGGNGLKVKTSRGELSWKLAQIRQVWWSAIGRLMEA
jgi:phosphoribosylformylglycinamidine synthase